MENIILKINENEFHAEFDKENYSLIYINKKPYEIELLKKFGDDVFSFAVNQKLYQVDLDFDKEGNLEISYDGMSFEINITNETRKMLQKFITQSGTGSKIHSGIVKAPMPGMIIKIYVQEGMHVLKGDKLIIIEAMKMENVLKSTVSGVIKSIKVKEGIAIEKDAVLFEIEVV